VVYAYQSGKDSTETRAAGTRGTGAGRGTGGDGRGAGGDGRGTAAAGTGAARGTGGRAAAAAARPATLGTNAILYAFDAENGKQLFSISLDSFNHFSNPVVAGGSVYAVTWDGKLYAFGLKK
jgi:outer membrane protein assembly factor BamB